MLRENKDVFKVFTSNLIDIVFEHKALDLAEPLVHLMMKDLTCSIMNKKLIYIIYHTVFKITNMLQNDEKSGDPKTKSARKLKDKLFFQLTRSIEAKQSA